MKAMPIACQLISKKQLRHPLRPGASPVELAAFVAEAAQFDIQVASDLYWLGSQNYYSLESDFGPLRLPFSRIWMEWSIPSEVLIEGKWVTNPPRRMGMLMEETSEADGYLIQSIAFSVDPVVDDVPELSPLNLRFNVDGDGRLINDGRGVRSLFDTSAVDRITANNHYRDDIKHLFVSCLALNLINCKNVTTEVAGHVPVPRSGAQKRRREPGIEYRTIRLPGSPCGGEATGENEGIMPHHRVRGHFKTFTPDSPLLGKHTGTYWWGWQVRGKKANGEIISDYELKDAS